MPCSAIADGCQAVVMKISGQIANSGVLRGEGVIQQRDRHGVGLGDEEGPF